MNVILYCRTCTNKQTDCCGCSLDIQEQILREYCNRHNYNVIGEPYREVCSSTHQDFRRPIMKQLYEYCRKHKQEVDKVLFLRWDRLTRYLEFAFIYKRKFYDELGIEINSIESPIDFKGAEWPMLLAMYCGISYTEDEKISRRTKDGVHGTLLKGKWSNKAPRGYLNKRTESGEPYVDINEVQAKTIRQVFKEVAKGAEAPNLIRRRLCPHIPSNTFYKMLRNIFYIGLIRVPAYKDAPEQIVKGQHKGIIDAETFDKVQDILSGKTYKETNNNKRQYNRK